LYIQFMRKIKVILFIASAWLIFSTINITANSGVKHCSLNDWHPKKFRYTKPAKEIKSTALYTLQGEKKDLQDYNKHGIILNFWATWCAPCIKEMPGLAGLQKTLSKDKIEVLMLSVDHGTQMKISKLIMEFLHSNNLKGLRSFWDKDRAIMRSLDIRGLPTTIFIDSKGYEIGRIAGLSDYGSYRMKYFIRNCLY